MNRFGVITAQTLELDCSNDALSSRIENIMNNIGPKIGSTTFNTTHLLCNCCSILRILTLIVSFFPNIFHTGRGKRYAEFRIRGHVRHMKFKDVTRFKKILSKGLNIPLRHINLLGIGKGSVILVFQIPEVGAERLRNSLEKKDTWLWENGVLDVHIDGEEFVQIQTEQYLGKTLNIQK